MTEIYSGVQYRTISTAEAGQRLDNFLFKHFPDLPKSRIYQMLRKGEVRRNKGRVKAEYKIQAGDVIRIPPLHQKPREEKIIPSYWLEALRSAVLYEDEDYLLLNKPAGLAVHGGSGQDYGLIDVVYALWGQHYAELAHRIDRDTSGLLVLAKTRAALADFQEQLKTGAVEKHYLCLVSGDFSKAQSLELKLLKVEAEDGERMLVHGDGKTAISHFQPLARAAGTTLLAVRIETGRTHQIRASLQHLGYGIVGDDKYGQREENKRWKRFGYRGMFLHAHRLCFRLRDGRLLALIAPLPAAAQDLWQQLKNLPEDEIF